MCFRHYIVEPRFFFEASLTKNVKKHQSELVAFIKLLLLIVQISCEEQRKKETYYSDVHQIHQKRKNGKRDVW